MLKKDVEEMASDSNWQNLALDIEEWKIICETGWSKSLINPISRNFFFKFYLELYFIALRYFWKPGIHYAHGVCFLSLFNFSTTIIYYTKKPFHNRLIIS